MASLDASAFSKERHEQYTAEAREVYHSCMSGIAPPESWAAFAKGVPAEDAWALWRLANWHYAYIEGGAIPDRLMMWPLPVRARTDFRHQFDRRVQEMVAGARDKDVGKTFEAAGRIAHYIQDMRVPAHVIPIHHGSILGDDGFDTHDFGAMERVPADCAALSTFRHAPSADWTLHRDELLKLATAAASETRRMMEQDLVPGVKARRLFWCLPEEVVIDSACGDAGVRGMGAYRKGQPFGATEFIDGKEPTGDRYRALFRSGYAGLLLDTARVYAYAARLLRGEEERVVGGGPASSK